MDFGISEEQQMIQDAAKKLMEKEIAPILAKYPEGSKPPLEEIKILLKKLIPSSVLARWFPPKGPSMLR